MPNPYELLGVNAESSDEAIRRAYLERVRERPPEHYCEEFAALRSAYEKVATLRDRLDLWLFDPACGETLDEVVAEVRSRILPRRPRWTLERIRAAITRK